MACDGETYLYHVTPALPNATYNWSVLPPNAGSTVNAIISHNDSCAINFGNAGTAIIRVIVGNSGVTTVLFDTIMVHHHPLPVIVNISGVGCEIKRPPHGEGKPENPSTCHLVCDSSTILYRVDSAATGSHFHWAVTGGALSIDSGYSADQHLIAVHWGAANSSDFQLMVSQTDSSGCTGTAEFCIHILQKPSTEIVTPNENPTGSDTLHACHHRAATALPDMARAGLRHWQ